MPKNRVIEIIIRSSVLFLCTEFFPGSKMKLQLDLLRPQQPEKAQPQTPCPPTAFLLHNFLISPSHTSSYLFTHSHFPLFCLILLTMKSSITQVCVLVCILVAWSVRVEGLCPDKISNLVRWSAWSAAPTSAYFSIILPSSFSFFIPHL